jgi:hypothetical protein
VESRLLFGHIPTGRAVHYIFSFPKEGKEKDAISISYAGVGFISEFVVKLMFGNCSINNVIFVRIKFLFRRLKHFHLECLNF